MADDKRWRHSLKRKIILGTLTVFVAAIWALSYFASHMLRQDMERLLADQQFSTVSYIAAQLNGELEARVQAVAKVARSIDPRMLDDPPALQRSLDLRLVFQDLFNAGVLVLSRQGTALADAPVVAGRKGHNYATNDAVNAALTEGRPAISRPVIGARLHRPLFGIAAPIRDARGTVIGALVGVTDLAVPNFLDAIGQHRYGRSGGYLIVDHRDNLFVTATDKSRVLQRLPGPGLNPMADRGRRGFEGSVVAVSSRGVEELSSAKRIPATGWYLVATLPTEEAFAPIRSMQRRIVFATMLLTLMMGMLSWWLLRRQFSPLLGAVEELSKMSTAMSTASAPLRPLPIKRQDEIGQLVDAFNRLLETLNQREAHLHALVQTIPDLVWLKDPDGVYLSCNPRFERLYGANESEIVGKTDYDFVDKEMADAFRKHDREAISADRPSINEEWLSFAKDAYRGLFETIKTPMHDTTGKLIGVLGIARDITERKEAESSLRIAAIAFESQEGMVITDAAGTMLRVNRAFTEITGYPAGEALGRNMSQLKSGRHDAAFYAEMWQSIRRTGLWQGEVWNRRKNGEVYPEWLTITAVKGDDGKTSHYVAALTDITLRKAAEDEIKHLAFYDPLTRLPNRRLLLDRLHQALAACGRSHRQGALLFIDLDNFKTLNDTLGHDIGDVLLQEVTQRLTGCVREGDTVARLGGDEFVIMLEDLSENAQEAGAQSQAVGEKALAAVNRPYLLVGHAHSSSASIGVTLFDEHHRDVNELLKRADLAMYQAKAAGRNLLRFFDQGMQAAVTARAAMETELRAGIEAGQLLLHYQAQVDGEGRLTGAEALVRWQHPQRGLVFPAEFIPLAEETGLILPLGQWVLETACARLAAWAAAPATSRLVLAVNVSPRQFRQQDFVERVLAVLDRSGAEPEKLKLELTESLLLDNVEETIAKMEALKARGIKFSLDDFGTGYSSLSYLKRLPLDQLKIDQSFVRELPTGTNDTAIACTIMALGRSLGMAVIAEGVETEAQRDILARHGCLAYQGFLFSRPLPSEEFERLLERTDAVTS